MVCEVFDQVGRAPRVAAAAAAVTCAMLFIGCSEDGGDVGGAVKGPSEPKPHEHDVVQPVVPDDTALGAIWGSSAKDVWVVGASGTILHYDGTQLSSIESGVDTTLLAVHGTGPNDVWFVGEYGITLHWDGTAVSVAAHVEDEALLGVWANAPDDVWAVGSYPRPNGGRIGVMRHWNGTRWEELAIPPATSLWEVWSTGSDNVWAVGTSTDASGIVLHGEGDVVSQVEFDGNPLRGVWGTDANDVWVLPYDSPLQHWDGEAFSLTDSQVEKPMLGMWGSSSDDVWAVGLEGTILHYDGSSWERSAPVTDVTLWSVWGSASDDVWVAGGAGTLLRWDGKDWTELEVAMVKVED